MASRTSTLAISAVVTIAILIVLGPTRASGATLTECQRAREEQRGAAKNALVRESQACDANRPCLKEAQSRWKAVAKRIDEVSAACDALARSQARSEPPPYLGWKPGDPPPRAKDGRLYLMSCNGKVLGLYKPGGALEMELKTRQGHCMPSDTWGDMRLKSPEMGYCPDGSWGTAARGCVHASPPIK